MVELCITVALLAIVLNLWALFRLSEMEKRVVTFARLDGKLDALLKHAGVEYNPRDNLSDEVVQALGRGDKIQAIRHYRSATGAGLREAKDFIEELERH